LKTLVIGGNGFIGSHLVDALLEAGHEVVVLDIQDRRYGATPACVHFIRGDLNQVYLLREALIGVEVVFHLAWATIHETSNQDPAADVRLNLIPSLQLFDACRQMGVRKVLFASSGGTVYGPAQQLPILESHPKEPRSGYGITKLAVEKYLQMYHHLHGLDYAILRPSVPYGPRQNPLGRQGAVAVFLYRVARGLPITIWGDGSVTRDFFYISDLTDAFLAAAAQNLGRDRVFNIGGAEEISLLQLVAAVETTVGRKAQVEHLPARKFDAPRLALDTTLARKVLGWQPRVGLAEGLRRTWEWMAEAVGDAG